MKTNLMRAALGLALLLYTGTAFSQNNSVGVNTNSPNSNAVLELVSPSSNQGFLVPRITTSDRNGMSLTNNENGLMVYDTDSNLFYYWNNGGWNAGLGVLNGNTAGGDLTGSYPNPTIRLGAVVEDKVADGAIATSKLQNESVTTSKLANSSITTEKVSDLSITGAKLENSGVAAGTYGNSFTVLQLTTDIKGRITGIVETPILITSTHITDLSILNEDLANGTITISKIDSESNVDKVLTVDVSGNVVWTDRSEFTSSALNQNNLFIGDATGTAQGLPAEGDITFVNTGPSIDVQIKTDAITSNEISTDAVGSDEIATDAVGVDEIANDAVNSDEIANDAVGNSEIADDAVTTNKILDGEVNTSDIATGAVTVNELADNSVSTIKILPDNVTRSEINPDVAGDGINQASDGSLAVNNGSGLRITSDFLEVNLGDFDGDGLIEDATNQELDLNVDNATLEVATDALQVKDLGITNAKIASDAVTSDKIALNTIVADDIATGAVTADEILDDNVTRTEINPDVAGDGITQATDGSLAVNNGNGLQITSDVLEVNMSDLAGDGIIEDNTNGELDINVDNTTLEVNTDLLQVKDLGITNDKIADDAVTSDKIALNTIVADDIATGAVTSDEILDETIQNEDIANQTILAEFKISPKNFLGVNVANRVFITSQNGQNTQWFGLEDDAVLATNISGDLISKPLTDFATNSLAPGSMFIGNLSGQAIAQFVSNPGQIMIGQGSSIASLPLTGDLIISNPASGLTAIQPNAIQGDNIDLTIVDFTVDGPRQFRMNNTLGLQVTNATDLNGVLMWLGKQTLQLLV